MIKIYSTLFSVVLLLTACGGGSDSSAPEPAPIPVPAITSFTASTTQITEGEEVKLTAVFSDGQGTIDVGVGNINSSSFKMVKPNTTTTYTLTVENSAGIKVSSSITIEIVRLKIINVLNRETVHDRTPIKVSIIANDGLARLTAQVAGRQEVLLSNGGKSTANDIDEISGALSLTGLTDGEYLLTITARDYLARTVRVEKNIIVDNVPVIRINSPTQQHFFQCLTTT